MSAIVKLDGAKKTRELQDRGALFPSSGYRSIGRLSLARVSFAFKNTFFLLSLSFSLSLSTPTNSLPSSSPTNPTNPTNTATTSTPRPGTAALTSLLEMTASASSTPRGRTASTASSSTTSRFWRRSGARPERSSMVRRPGAITPTTRLGSRCSAGKCGRRGGRKRRRGAIGEETEKKRREEKKTG